MSDIAAGEKNRGAGTIFLPIEEGLPTVISLRLKSTASIDTVPEIFDLKPAAFRKKEILTAYSSVMTNADLTVIQEVLFAGKLTGIGRTPHQTCQPGRRRKIMSIISRTN
jgi:hypothetical protein